MLQAGSGRWRSQLAHWVQGLRRTRLEPLGLPFATTRSPGRALHAPFGPVQERPAATERALPRPNDSADADMREPIPLALLGILALGALLLIGLTRSVGAPTTFPDELVYFRMARDLATSGTLSFGKGATSTLTYGPLYPVLLAPIFRLPLGGSEMYFVLRVLNALMFASAGFPAWLVARRYLGRSAALGAAGAAIAIPAAAYTAKLMTESLAYPLFITAILATLRAAEQPTARRQLVMVGAVVSMAMVRAELGVMIFVCAGVCLATGDPPFWPRLRRLLPTVLVAGALGGLAVAYLLLILARGGLAAHAFVLGRLDPWHWLQSFSWHLALIDLYCGVVPCAAFIHLAGRTLRNRADPARALVLLAGGSALTLSVVSSAYLVALPPRYRQPVPVLDRYTFYCVPLLLIALGVWLERGMMRSRGARVAGVAAACLPLTLPLLRLFPTARGDVSAIGLLPLGDLRLLFPSAVWLFPVLLCYCAIGAWVFSRAKTPRRLLELAAAHLWILTLVSIATVRSSAQLVELVSPSQHWLDSAVPGPVIGLRTTKFSTRSAYAIADAEILSRRVVRVFDLSDVRRLDDGEVLVGGRVLRARYVIAPKEIRLANDVVARSRGLVIYRTSGGVRLLSGAGTGAEPMRAKRPSIEIAPPVQRDDVLAKRVAPARRLGGKPSPRHP